MAISDIESWTTVYTEIWPDIALVVGCISPGGSTQYFIGPKQVITQGDQQKPKDKTDLTPQTLFEIGSTTKLFTAGIFANEHPSTDTSFPSTPLGCYTEGLWASNPSCPVAQIPVCDLASFASGLPPDNGEPCAPTPTPFLWPSPLLESIESMFKSTDYPGLNLLSYTPTLPAGGQYTYSNMGYALLGMAAVNQQLYDDGNFLDNFSGALASYCQLVGIQAATPYTQFYYWDQLYNSSFLKNLAWGNSKERRLLSANKPPEWIPWLGSGGIVSNGEEMLTVLSYFVNTQPAWFQQLVPGEPSTGYKNYCKAGEYEQTGDGWFMTTWPPNSGEEIVSKDGSVLGFTSWIGIQPRANQPPNGGYGLFVLSNGPDAQPLGRLFYALMTDTLSRPNPTEAEVKKYLGVPASAP